MKFRQSLNRFHFYCLDLVSQALRVCGNEDLAQPEIDLLSGPTPPSGPAARILSNLEILTPLLAGIHCTAIVAVFDVFPPTLITTGISEAERVPGGIRKLI
jgi:hypothetical protein